jgi:hypothetical protein
MMKIMVAVFVLSLSIVIHGATIVSTSEVSPSEVSPTATSSSYTKLPTPTPQLVNDEELDASYERKFFNPQSMKFVTVKDGNLFADASPTDGTIFEVERYINSNETDTYYYKLRIVDTNEYVYFAPNRTLQVGVRMTIAALNSYSLSCLFVILIYTDCFL